MLTLKKWFVGERKKIFFNYCTADLTLTLSLFNFIRLCKQDSSKCYSIKRQVEEFRPDCCILYNVIN